MRVLKKSALNKPKLSIILLDWKCRENFFSLDSLNLQSVSRDQYELIWVELYDSIRQDVIDKVDTAIVCNQEGIYHKHKGYNAGVLNANGEIITVCDSDALFPPNFVFSIIESFESAWNKHENLLLMHYEWRTASRYPSSGLSSVEQVKNFTWEKLWPNVGACMSVRRDSAISFGGFDEHKTFRGYFCGPYDLGWRLINASFKEYWYPPDKAALWHFAHPHPCGEYNEKVSLRLMKEIRYLHIKGHALTAVKAFAEGRTMPKKENIEIHKTRMSRRTIGSEFEKEYSVIKSPLIKARIFSALSALSILIGIIAPNLRKKLKYYYNSKNE